MEVDRILTTLAAKGLRYRWLRATGRPGRPEALSIEVTRRCVARCVMCNIWRMQPTAPELQAGDWLKLLESPVFSGLKELDLTGGEPFLRDDIVELLLGIGRLKRRHLRQLCSVAITTNGLLTDKVLQDVAAVIAPLDAAGVTLVFACGLDAVGATHDRIRRFKGAWERLNATLEGLQALRQQHPSLVLGIKTTVTRYNIDEIEKVSRYAEARDLFAIISPYIITANRYGNLDREDSLSFSAEDLAKLKRFYNSARFRWSYYRNELLRFLDCGRMAKPCSAGFNYFFIRSTGELYSCPIIEALLGNVKDKPFEALIRSPEAERFRRNILKFPECTACTEPGLERYALPFEGFHYLRQYFKLGREEFRSLHRHLGLDKYFPG
jgi:MoaA/NifB/PqqE/SkfB family radical SAM enzyme